MSGLVSFLNHHKESIKNVFGLGNLGIGAQALYHAASGKIYTKYARKADSGDKSTVDRVTLAFLQTSLVLSGAVSPVGVWGISKVVNKIFTSSQLEKVFGPNTNFVGNWKHPRHIVSLAAVAFALPFVLKRLFVEKVPEKQIKLERYAYFTLLTSRPVLHLGNQLAHYLFKK